MVKRSDKGKHREHNSNAYAPRRGHYSRSSHQPESDADDTWSSASLPYIFPQSENHLPAAPTPPRPGSYTLPPPPAPSRSTNRGFTPLTGIAERPHHTSSTFSKVSSCNTEHTAPYTSYYYDQAESSRRSSHRRLKGDDRTPMADYSQYSVPSTSQRTPHRSSNAAASATGSSRDNAQFFVPTGEGSLTDTTTNSGHRGPHPPGYGFYPYQSYDTEKRYKGEGSGQGSSRRH